MRKAGTRTGAHISTSPNRSWKLASFCGWQMRAWQRMVQPNRPAITQIFSILSTGTQELPGVTSELEPLTGDPSVTSQTGTFSEAGSHHSRCRVRNIKSAPPVTFLGSQRKNPTKSSCAVGKNRTTFDLHRRGERWAVVGVRSC